MKNQLDEELESLIKTRIVELTLVNRGLKYADLVLKVISENTMLEDETIIRIIHELVQDRLLVQIEYILPDRQSSVYTFYLPGNSRVL